MEERLSKDGLFSNDDKFYNVGVSYYECIKDNIGESCTNADGKEGTCVMLQTSYIQQTYLVDWH